MKLQRCEWKYRGGTNGSHWALTSCKSKWYVYLSRLIDKPYYKGCADYYDGRKCCVCGKTIKITYDDWEGVKNEIK